MNIKALKILTKVTLVILTIIITYKAYLSFHESNFTDNNYKNIKKIVDREVGDNFSFAVIGSVENSIGIFQNKIIKNINADQKIGFTISTGNAVLDGAEDKYRILNNSLKKLNKPSIVGIGNREVSDEGETRFYKHYGAYFFSFAYQDSYFIFVDTTGVTALDSQRNWLLAELAIADTYHHKFVFMNDSPVNTQPETDNSKNIEFNNFMIDAFSEHSITSVFTNGTAVYKSKVIKGVPYYASGGAGGFFSENAAESFYHYLKVTVSYDAVLVEEVKEPWAMNHPWINKLESIWIFIHSIFYAQFVNLLLVIFLILLVILMLYKKASQPVDYYRDFRGQDTDENSNKSLNIAMFTNNYLPFIGGVPISIDRLSKSLQNRGNKVIVFSPKYPGSDPNEKGVYRCKLLYYKKKGTFHYSVANIYDANIEKEFIKHNFDIIHVHHPFWMGKKGLSLGKKYHIPVILTYHTRLEMYSNNLPILKLVFKNILSHRLIRNFGQNCDGIIAPTLSAKEYLENVGISRQKLILPTGIDFSNYEAADVKEVKLLRDRYTPNGERLLCSVSRLSIEKNISFLINGLALVKELTNVSFQCILIGEGPEQEIIQKLIDECNLSHEVHLIGSVSQKEISKYYLASDAFIFSSLSETQGMVLLEAMAGSCPVVCVRSSGTDDVIYDGVNGYKTFEDINEWAAKVKEILENNELLAAMSSQAYSYAREYSLEKMSEKVDIFYRKIISGK